MRKFIICGGSFGTILALFKVTFILCTRLPLSKAGLNPALSNILIREAGLCCRSALHVLKLKPVSMLHVNM